MLILHLTLTVTLPNCKLILLASGSLGKSLGELPGGDVQTLPLSPTAEAELACIFSEVVMLWLVVQQEILVTEKVVLEGLRFDLLVELPYVHLLRFIKLLQGYLLLLIVLMLSISCSCLYYHIRPVVHGSSLLNLYDLT